MSELTEDHRRIDGLCQLIQSTPWGDPRRKRAVGSITAELARHAEAESRFLYPAVRRRVPGGRNLAADGLAEHVRIGHCLTDLAEHEPDDAQFDLLVTRLVFEAHEHAAAQERELFPHLAAAAGAGELPALAESLRAARRPTALGRGVQQPEPGPMERSLSGGGALTSYGAAVRG
ncbi:hemerythrin domain-containing protein [Streptodolium elevatio]